MSICEWSGAEDKLRELFPDDTQRGEIRSCLLPLTEARRLEYFQDEDKVARYSLLALVSLSFGNGLIAQ